MTDQVISASGVTKTFGSANGTIHAVRDVSFTVSRGEVVALLGDNGAGKSTLLDLVCGLSTPTAGTVQVFGDEPHRVARSGRLAAMLQSGGLLPDITVTETLGLAARLFGLPKAAVSNALVEAGLQSIADRRIGVCSGGERQRVKYALALLPAAPLMVFDEPTAGMDWHSRADFWRRIRQLTERGRTLLYATHYSDEVDRVADRVLIMREGGLLANEPLLNLTQSAAHRRVVITLTAQATNAAARDGLIAALRTRSGVLDVRVDSSIVRLDVERDRVHSLLVDFLPDDRIRHFQLEDPALFEIVDELAHRGRP